MLVTLSGSVMLARLVQLWKAPDPMLVTLFGSVMLVRFVQSRKVSVLILVTEFPSIAGGITNSPEAV